MREIIEIDKDFLSGIEKKSNKKKPESKTKGKVTVSLFDEGNKVREIKTENLIMDWFKEDAYNYAYRRMLAEGASGASLWFGKPTAYMLLSNKNSDEDPKDMFGYGDVIGYCVKRTAHSSSSTLQGSYNEKESSTTIQEDGTIVVHEVYDFPTHVANGTIKSIMWAPYNSNASSTNAQSWYHYWKDTSMYPNGLWFDGGNNGFKINKTLNRFLGINKNWRLTEYGGEEVIGEPLKAPDGNIMNTSNKTISYNIISSQNIEGVVLCSSSASNGFPLGTNLCKWNGLTGEITMQKTVATPAIKTTSGEDFYVFDVVREGNYIYYSVYNGKKIGVAKVDMNGNVVSVIELENSESYSSKYCDMNFIGRRIVLTTRYKTYFINTNLEVEHTTNDCKSVYAASRDFDNITVSGSYNGSCVQCEFKMLLNPITTYVKLPNEITKTNTNTMKVQYDFVIEPPKHTSMLAGGVDRNA